MKVSIFTAHFEGTNPYINETYRSLVAQTYSDWEWVILVNNGGIVPKTIIKDERVCIFTYPDDKPSNIGALKKAACGYCTGDILLELDADDLLTPDALEVVAEEFQDQSVEFVYSNSAQFEHGTWKSSGYSEYWGWKSRPFQWKGHTLIEMVAFSPTVHSIRGIWWAPNHIRAWRTETYNSIGGHDSTLLVADDHDLVCRTYLGAKMKHIDRCLYLYRIHDGNSVKRFNQEIQVGCWKNYEKYILRMAEHWTRENGLKLIDLGASHGKPNGYLGLDCEANADLVCNLEKGIPLPDNSCGIVRAYDILEHLNPVAIMNEIYRVLAPGGWLFISVPSTDGRGAFQDPTHISFWNSNSFWYYTNPQYQKYVSSINTRFQVSRVMNWFPSDFHKQNNIPYVDAQLISTKDNFRAPGECLWPVKS